jgi:hypothetical protein
LFATIVDDMFALEFDELNESWVLTVHRRWKWAHTFLLVWLGLVDWRVVPDVGVTVANETIPRLHQPSEPG